MTALARFEELVDRAIRGDHVALVELPDVTRSAWGERCASWAHLTGRLHEVLVASATRPRHPAPGVGHYDAVRLPDAPRSPAPMIPRKAPRLCPRGSCTEHVPCPKHPPRAPWSKKGKSGRGGRPWRRLRNQVLAEEPLCRMCGKRLSVTPDHIVPVAEGGPSVRENLQGACKVCHDRKTQDEARRARG